MEVNRDEAARALAIAQSKWQSGNKAAALKFARKSNALYPTDKAQKAIAEFETASAPANSDTIPKAAENSGLRNRKDNVQTEKKEESSKSSSSGKVYTEEQAVSVKRVMAVKDDYYKVLAIERTATEIQIKKAYRKSALLFHPDKNTAPGADEAFKLVAHAFNVLSDADKRAHYDRFGVETRSSGSSSGMSGFGHSGRGFGNGHGSAMFEDEVSPEDLFNMFFGGDFGQFGVQFGPGVRFQQRRFGGAQSNVFGQQQRFQQQQQQRRRQNEQDESILGTCIQFLPVILLVFSYFVSSLFSIFAGSEAAPSYSFTQTPRYSLSRATQYRNVQYWVNGAEFGRSPIATRRSDLRSFEQDIEAQYISRLQRRCRDEMELRRRKYHAAKGWFGVGDDRAKMTEAKNMPMPACDELTRLK